MTGRQQRRMLRFVWGVMLGMLAAVFVFPIVLMAAASLP